MLFTLPPHQSINYLRPCQCRYRAPKFPPLSAPATKQPYAIITPCLYCSIPVLSLRLTNFDVCLWPFTVINIQYLDAYTQNTQHWSGVGLELFWGQKWLCWLPRGSILSTNRPLQIWIWVQIMANYPTVACNTLITLYWTDNKEEHLRKGGPGQSRARAIACSGCF